MQYNLYYYTCELALFNAAHETAYEKTATAQFAGNGLKYIVYDTT